MQVTHLFAGKPQAFGPRRSPSSIIKSPHTVLNINKEGALEDEQGNKKLHGGPYMALHQYAQESYPILASEFPNTKVNFCIGSIGENISVPEMNESNVFIGDHYAIGSVVLQVVSPRAPCSMINHRYGKKKIDQYIAKLGLTGWYFSVVQEGQIKCDDQVSLIDRTPEQVSVGDIWRLRNIKNTLNESTDIDECSEQLNIALSITALSPEWQGHLSRVKSFLKVS